MKVVIVTAGSRGDVQPYLALGLGLQRAGHDVRLATHAEFEAFVRGAGLDFAPIAGNAREVLQGPVGVKWVASAKDPISFVRYAKRIAEPTLAAYLQDCWTACQGAEVIVYSFLGFAGWHVAQGLGVPCLAARYAPFDGLPVMPRLFRPGPLGLGNALNKLNTRLGPRIAWLAFLRREVNRWRQETLGLEALPLSGWAGRVDHQRVPFLFGYSPAVVPKLPHWPPWYHVTGYWLLHHAADWQPPATLAAFLAAGPPPVVVSTGSTAYQDYAALTSLTVEALRRAGQRGVIVTGWGGMGQADLPDDVFLIDDVPFDWLFPRVAAVIHNGGSGTTGWALWAGVPSVAMPLYADQPFWGAQVAKLGVGPPPLSAKRLTAARLAGAIRAMTSDVGMQDRARALGRQIRSEDGPARAVEIFEAYVQAAYARGSRFKAHGQPTLSLEPGTTGTARLGEG